MSTIKYDIYFGTEKIFNTDITFVYVEIYCNLFIVENVYFVQFVNITDELYLK